MRRLRPWRQRRQPAPRPGAAPLPLLAALLAVLLAPLILSPGRWQADASETVGETVGDSVYVAEVEAWRARREAGLQRPAGWLSLVGLVPLTPGRHTLGSAPDRDVSLPASAPGRVGVLLVDSTRVELEVEAGVTVTVAGDSSSAPVDHILLEADTTPGGPTRVVLESLTWWVIERDGERYLRVSDSDGPVLRDFRGLAWYPADPAWRLPARWVPPEWGRTIHVPTVLGTTAQEPSGGWLEFEIDGATHRLEVPKDEDGFFVIFADASNGDTTYGAGRFLWVERPADGESLFVDFNRAYNPPCAFTPYATCPLPPPGNVLPVAVTAGERDYGGH